MSLSPWPLIISIRLLFFRINLVYSFYIKFDFLVLLNFFLILIVSFFWWNDVILESNYLGFHNKYVIIITIYRIILFIISEIFFFISFFWTFFHFLFSPDIENGSIWPYKGIYEINYISLPLLNSLLLIRRGCSITWRHYKLLANNFKDSKFRLLLTINLGFIFLLCQIFEYKISRFSFSDGIFGSIFFIATGFHGIHVLIGRFFLFFIFIRIQKNHFSYSHMLGFEFSIWYWHFVDLVWLYLYIIIYWFGRI